VPSWARRTSETSFQRVRRGDAQFRFSDSEIEQQLRLQFDDVSDRVQANIRLNWLHTPGSNLFVVLDTGYNAGDLLDPRDSRWERRTGLVKITYLWAL
jgi:hypothetical protein